MGVGKTRGGAGVSPLVGVGRVCRRGRAVLNKLSLGSAQEGEPLRIAESRALMIHLTVEELVRASSVTCFRW